MKNKKIQQTEASRRDFIKSSALAFAGITLIPRHVLGGPGFIAPSDKLRVASIGVGGMGYGDLTGVHKSGKVDIISLCDVDDTRAAKGRQDHSKASYYKDYRVLLEKEEKNIDAITVSTPDHMHAVQAMMAMKMGKHVYVQKPLSHDIYEARMLTQAAEKYRVVTQMGNQGSSGDGVRKMVEWYEAGLIGEATKVWSWTNRPVWPQGIPWPSTPIAPPADLDWDLWLGTAPYKDYVGNLVPFNWRGWWDYGTGALGDMACHIMDPVFRCLPILYPSDVECSVASIWKGMWDDTANTDSCPPSTIIHLTYPRTDGKKGDIKVSWYDGGLLPQRPDELLPEEAFGNWDGGVLFIGTKGKLLADCYGAKPRLLPTKLMKDVKMPKQTIQRVPEGHYLQWVNACIAGYGNGKTSSPFEFAGPFTESILIGNLAIRSWMMKNPNLKGWNDKYLGRKKLIWDAKNMQITNFDPANQFVKRDYRDGWKLEL